MDKKISQKILSQMAFANDFINALTGKLQLPVIAGNNGLPYPLYMGACSGCTGSCDGDCSGGCLGDCRGGCRGCDSSCEGYNR